MVQQTKSAEADAEPGERPPASEADQGEVGEDGDQGRVHRVQPVWQQVSNTGAGLQEGPVLYTCTV